MRQDLTSSSTETRLAWDVRHSLTCGLGINPKISRKKNPTTSVSTLDQQRLTRRPPSLSQPGNKSTSLRTIMNRRLVAIIGSSGWALPIAMLLWTAGLSGLKMKLTREFLCPRALRIGIMTNYKSLHLFSTQSTTVTTIRRFQMTSEKMP